MRKIGPGRITAQYLFNPAVLLHEILPVHAFKKAQAGYAVGNRKVFRRLFVTVFLQALCDSCAFIDKGLLYPVKNDGYSRALSLKPSHKFGKERSAELRLSVHEFG